MIKKELIPTNDLMIQFTEDELAQLNVSVGDKFEVKLQDGGILLKPMKKIEIDIDEFDINTLKLLVKRSFDEDKTCNDVIIDVLSEAMENDPLFVGLKK
jgi:hypothetical protein